MDTGRNYLVVLKIVTKKCFTFLTYEDILKKSTFLRIVHKEVWEVVDLKFKAKTNRWNLLFEIWEVVDPKFKAKMTR